MFCPKCGVENPEGANFCRSCGGFLTIAATATAAPAVKTSGLAIASLVLGILSIFATCLTGLPAIILGIISLVKISRSKGQLKGMGLAIAGIVTSCVLPIFTSMAILMPALARTRMIAHRMVCGAEYGRTQQGDYSLC